MKKFTYAPFLDILFDRTVLVELTTPGGKTVKALDDAPPVLRMDTPDGYRMFQSTAGGFVQINDDNKIPALIKDFAGATPSKRLPKF